MKLVTIVRHAHAVAEAPGGMDFRRRLDAQGKQEAREMATLARATGLRPDRLLASPAARTLATARVFAAALEIPARRIERVAAIYGGELDTLTDLLRALPASVSHALLVGH